VKLFDTGENYMSRSQAKRLLHSLENFKVLILDFSGVNTVGQAFADEIFRVFNKTHPDIKIEAINCNENIRFMIGHAAPKLKIKAS
ncbi:MAG: STAS-like domain-containing protein, partial [Deltaproteobacteria bacterium]|nr:STAS-like domain-containing protein [Deltaproteobacteria bacterium]